MRKAQCLGLLALLSLSAYGKEIHCTIQDGKGLNYLPSIVTLNPEVKTSHNGLEYLLFKGLTSSGDSYSGGAAYFQNLEPQIVFQVSEYSDSKVVLEEHDEFRKDTYSFDLEKKELKVKVKTSKLPFFPKVFTMARGQYFCQ